MVSSDSSFNVLLWSKIDFHFFFWYIESIPAEYLPCRVPNLNFHEKCDYLSPIFWLRTARHYKIQIWPGDLHSFIEEYHHCHSLSYSFAELGHWLFSSNPRCLLQRWRLYAKWQNLSSATLPLQVSSMSPLVDLYSSFPKVLRLGKVGAMRGFCWWSISSTCPIQRRLRLLICSLMVQVLALPSLLRW